MTEIKVWKASVSFKGLIETQGLEKDRIKRIIEGDIKDELTCFDEVEELKVTLELL